MALQSALGSGTDSYLVETGITASGTTQGTAYRLRSQISEVTTVASGAGVILDTDLTSGEEQRVFNAGANTLKVYPASGVQINGLPANQAINLPVNTGVIFTSVSTTRVFGVLSA